jgi:hypothetical protein
MDTVVARFFRAVVAMVVLASVAVATPAHAEEGFLHQRGPLTGVGIGLLVVSSLGLGLGIGGAATIGSANQTLSAFLPNGPPMSEAAVAAAANKQILDATPVMVVGFVLTGVTLAASIICFVVDGRPARVSFVPTPQGGAFAFSMVW